MSRAPLNILLIEDEPDDAELFTLALERERLKALLLMVTSGKPGRAFLSGRGIYQDRDRYPFPDLVVLGLLRDGSGLEFLKWCRAAKAGRDLPLVVLTGVMKGDKRLEAAARHGPNRLFLKPIGLSGLSSTVRQIYDFGLEHRSRHSTAKPRKASPRGSLRGSNPNGT